MIDVYKDIFYFEIKSKKITKVSSKNGNTIYNRVNDSKGVIATRINLFYAYFVTLDGPEMNVEILWT